MYVVLSLWFIHVHMYVYLVREGVILSGGVWCVCARSFVCECVCVRLSVFVFARVCEYVNVYKYVYVCARVCVCLFIGVCIDSECMCVRVSIYRCLYR